MYPFRSGRSLCFGASITRAAEEIRSLLLPQITLRSSGVNKILPLRGNGQDTACRRYVTRLQAQLTPYKHLGLLTCCIFDAVIIQAMKNALRQECRAW